VEALLIHPGIERRRLESPELSDLNRVYLSAVNKPLQRSRMDLQQCGCLVAVEQWFSAHLSMEAVIMRVCGIFHFVLHLCSSRQRGDKIAISARFIHHGSEV
jgi:hypothetical protein